MNDNFALAIRTRRVQLGLSEEGAAGSIGKPVARLRSLELGVSSPTVGEARALGRLLGIPEGVMRDLLRWDKDGIPLKKD